MKTLLKLLVLATCLIWPIGVAHACSCKSISPEAGFDQARKTFEKFVSTAQTAADSIEERGATVRAGAKDVGAKAMAYAEKNVQSSLDYAENLLPARDPPEMLRLHGE